MVLKPEFDAIKGKLVEHEHRFAEVLGRFDAISHRIGRFEDESLTTNSRLKRIEALVGCGEARTASGLPCLDFDVIGR